MCYETLCFPFLFLPSFLSATVSVRRSVRRIASGMLSYPCAHVIRGAAPTLLSLIAPVLFYSSFNRLSEAMLGFALRYIPRNAEGHLLDGTQVYQDCVSLG